MANALQVNATRVRQVIALLEEVRQEALALYPVIDDTDYKDAQDPDPEGAYGDLYDLLWAMSQAATKPTTPDQFTVLDALNEVLQAWDQKEAGE